MQDRGGGTENKLALLSPAALRCNFGFLALGKDPGETGRRLDNRGSDVTNYAC